jgi:hypothetical protein
MNTKKDINAIQDILDLCRLNQIEDNIISSPAPDRDSTLLAIDWQRRQIVTRLANNPPSIVLPKPDADFLAVSPSKEI